MSAPATLRRAQSRAADFLFRRPHVWLLGLTALCLATELRRQQPSMVVVVWWAATTGFWLRRALDYPFERQTQRLLIEHRRTLGTLMRYIKKKSL